MRGKLLRLLTVAAAFAAMAFGLTGTHPAGAAGGYDWRTWGFDNARGGYNSQETILNETTVPNLVQQWFFQTGGANVAQALYASGVMVGGVARDIVYQAAESGKLFAIDAHTGAQIWVRSFGTRITDCENMTGGKFGISGTPAFDRGTNRIYVVPNTGNLYALSMSTGSTISGWPITMTSDPAHENVWGAITVKTNGGSTPNGTVYVPMASECNRHPHRGRIIRVSIANHAVLNRWFTNPAGRDGGTIWAYGGVALDSSGNVYTVPDEALPPPGNAGYSEHVLRLSYNLSVQASHFYQIPGNNEDESYGTTPNFYTTSCGDRFTILNKAGYLLTYPKNFTNATSPLQSIKTAGGGVNFKFRLGGSTAFDPVTKTILMGNPNSKAGMVKGLIAFRPNEAKAGCPLEVVWQQADPTGTNLSPQSMPVVANGIAYFGDGSGKQILAYRVSDGTLLWSSPKLDADIYSTPTVANGMLFGSTFNWSTPTSAHLYAFGLPTP
jgi:outer membrane protein assembly factor BamB